ncbi:uncharacterized protein [Porites lutea]|uniref:uncharacterized protein isoform X1 n=1 Tax=Porites lutea TaxID=51062 RepID=UPI003CC61632
MLLSLRLSLFLLFSSSFAETKDYEVKVKTANKLRASTDAPVYIEVKGTWGSLNKRELDKKNYDDFEQGRLDTYYFSDWDIGYVTGLTVYLGRGGWFPAWNLDYILIRIAGAKDAVFNYGGKEIKANSYVTLTHINECTMGIDSCDKTSSNCMDTDGDFWCRCKTGYNQGANNKLCVDVNECLNPFSCIEPATCENTVGSYKCNCPSGWVQKPGTNNQCQEAPSP